MRICICEDDQAQMNELKQLILHCDQQTEIIGFHSAEEMLFECNHTFPFDCIFLDIQMDEMNGIELAKQIRKDDGHVPLVFLTSCKDYVYEGYEVQALRYLLKPIDQAKVSEIFALIKDQKQTQKYVFIEVEKEKIKVDLADLLYLESCGHTCLIHTKNKTYEVRSPLQEISKQLDEDFIATHRSFIVRIGEIERIGKDCCTLSNHENIPISRNNYKSVNEAFIQYFQKVSLL